MAGELIAVYTCSPAPPLRRRASDWGAASALALRLGLAVAVGEALANCNGRSPADSICRACETPHAAAASSSTRVLIPESAYRQTHTEHALCWRHDDGIVVKSFQGGRLPDRGLPKVRAAASELALKASALDPHPCMHTRGAARDGIFWRTQAPRFSGLGHVKCGGIPVRNPASVSRRGTNYVSGEVTGGFARVTYMPTTARGLRPMPGHSHTHGRPLPASISFGLAPRHRESSRDQRKGCKKCAASLLCQTREPTLHKRDLRRD